MPGGLKQQVDQLYLAAIESGNIRYQVQPVGAPTACISDSSAAAWAWAAYVQIVAAAVIPTPCWLVGVMIHTGVVETHNGDIAIAIGAAAAEVDIAIIPMVAGIPTAVGVSVAGPYNLPKPIRIVGQPRMACRLRKDTVASLAGVSLKVVLATAIGT